MHALRHWNLRPPHSQDRFRRIEQMIWVYVLPPALDHDQISRPGLVRTRAFQLETEIRIDPGRRTDCFMERWQALNMRCPVERYRPSSRHIAACLISTIRFMTRQPPIPPAVAGAERRCGSRCATIPTPGGPEAQMTYRRQYAETLALRERLFGR